MKFVIKKKKVDRHFRYGIATLSDGTKKVCRRKKVFGEYEYYFLSKTHGKVDITSRVSAFKCTEYIDERGIGKDTQQ